MPVYVADRTLPGVLPPKIARKSLRKTQWNTNYTISACHACLHLTNYKADLQSISKSRCTTMCSLSHAKHQGNRFFFSNANFKYRLAAYTVNYVPNTMCILPTNSEGSFGREKVTHTSRFGRRCPGEGAADQPVAEPSRADSPRNHPTPKIPQMLRLHPESSAAGQQADYANSNSLVQ